jgi:hypothetical protein
MERVMGDRAAVENLQDRLYLIHQSPELLRLKNETLHKIKSLGYSVLETGEFPTQKWKLTNRYQEVDLDSLDALIHFYSTHAALSVKFEPINNNKLEIFIMFCIVLLCGFIAYLIS